LRSLLGMHFLNSPPERHRRWLIGGFLKSIPSRLARLPPTHSFLLLQACLARQADRPANLSSMFSPPLFPSPQPHTVQTRISLCLPRPSKLVQDKSISGGRPRSLMGMHFLNSPPERHRRWLIGGFLKSIPIRLARLPPTLSFLLLQACLARQADRLANLYSVFFIAYILRIQYIICKEIKWLPESN
jgi:hypothetical protein